MRAESGARELEQIARWIERGRCELIYRVGPDGRGDAAAVLREAAQRRRQHEANRREGPDG